MRTDQEPISLLGAFEAASPMPIRPEYVEEMALVPSLPDHRHTKGAFELAVQLHSAGLLSGMGNGYRVADADDTTLSLVIPDFYGPLLHRPVLPGDDPKEAYYDAESKVGLGNPLVLPAPYPTLDTAPFLDK